MIADALPAVAVGKGSRLRWAAPSQHPSCNTGAICTDRTCAGVLIDNLGATAVGLPAQEIAHRLGGGFVAVSGRYGYARGLQRGNICIFYEGHDLKMGVMVDMSGQGCREAEASGLVTDWPRFLGELREWGFKFTRLDGAMDDLAGLLSLDEIWRKCCGGELVSLFRKARRTQSIDLHDAVGPVAIGEDGRSFRFEHKSLGDTVYMGSDKSEAKARFYNKTAERHAKGVEVEDEHWVRAEFQARNEKAEHLVTAILEYGAAGVAMMMRRHITFRDASCSDSNKRRWEVSVWWDQFLDSVAAFRAASSRDEKPETLLRKWAHVEKFVAPTLALLDRALGRVELDRLIDGAGGRLKPKHEALLSGWQASGWDIGGGLCPN